MGQHQLAKAAPLPGGVNRQHADGGVGLVALNMHTRHQLLPFMQQQYI